MNKNYKFKKHQIVKLWDGFTDTWYYGVGTKFSREKVVSVRWRGAKQSEEIDRTSDKWPDLKVCQAASKQNIAQKIV